MKHIFTFFAALSLLLCLFFIVVTAATFNSSWEVQLAKSESDQRTRSVGARYGELIYKDDLKDFGLTGLTKTTEEHLGYVVYKETKPANPKTGEAESTSYHYTLSPAYPIILFAILPLTWLVVRLGGQKRKAAGSHDSEEPAGTSPNRP
jgi:hypothetical protein